MVLYKSIMWVTNSAQGSQRQKDKCVRETRRVQAAGTLQTLRWEGLCRFKELEKV